MRACGLASWLRLDWASWSAGLTLGVALAACSTTLARSPVASRPARERNPVNTSTHATRPGPLIPTPGAATAASASKRNSFGERPFGERAPLWVERASPGGNWVSVCKAQPGEGGARGFERVLYVPDDELAIDAVLTSDAPGRHAVIGRGGQTLLWNSENQAALNLGDLGADVRISAEPFAGARTLAFDDAAEHLLYVRDTNTGSRIVMRSLHDGAETVLDPGPGSVWRARFDPGGAYVVAEIQPEHDASLAASATEEGPVPILSRPRPCTPGPRSFASYVPRGAPIETVLLPRDGAAAIHEPELVMPLGKAVVLRDAAGALYLKHDGVRQLLEPSACKGRIVHADPGRQLLIVGCAQKKKLGKMALELATVGGHKPLGIDVVSVDLDREVGDAPRLVPFYPGAASVLFDADQRALLPLQNADVVVATVGTHALVRRGNRLSIFDAQDRRERLLPGEVEKFPDVLVTAPFALVSPLLVDLEHAALVGYATARALALSNEGRLLTANSETTLPDGLVMSEGPLRWLTPSPDVK